MRVQTRRAIVEEVIAHCVLEVRAGHAARGCAFAVCRTAVITVRKPGACAGSCNRQVVRQGQGQKERGGAQTSVVTCMTTTRVTHAHPFQNRTIMAMRRSIKSRKVCSPPTTFLSRTLEFPTTPLFRGRRRATVVSGKLRPPRRARRQLTLLIRFALIALTDS